jgi:methyl-accepting chemotaxis protein
LDDAELWVAEEQIARSIADAEKVTERLAATAARHRSGVEAIKEKSNDFQGRTRSVSSELHELSSTLDKLSVVALNAGLEGARNVEGNGRALSLVSDELRTHLGRAGDALRTLQHELGGLQGAVDELGSRIDAATRDAQEVGQDAVQLKGVLQAGASSIGELESRLRKATGLDPEVAKLVSAAGLHAKGLVSALTGLDGRGATEATRSLGPALAPVRRLLSSVAPGLDSARADDREPSG